jgi:hypothetical protein
MRRALVLGCLLLAGCAGPHSTGALWAQQNIEQESALFRVGDEERAAQTRAFEVRLAQESLSGERARVIAGLQVCPGDVRPLGLSSGDQVRDTIRVQAERDPQTMAAVSQVALADWYLRRGGATGEAGLCERGRRALESSPSGADQRGIVNALGEATVTRNPHAAKPPSANSSDVAEAVSLYASLAIDVVHAPAPLPQYLASVYGGDLVSDIGLMPHLDGPAEQVVDDIAPAYPQWEPDALYAALRPLGP